MNRLKELRESKQLSQYEIGKILGITSQAYGHLENGKRDISTDYLKILSEFYNVSIDYILGLTNNSKESIDLTDKLFIIPIVGRVPAGEPLLAEENISGYLPIDPMMYHLTSPENLFFLKVVGESMNNVVPDGSYVLIKKQDYAETGDVVVALVNGDNEATLKRFKQLENNFVMLEPDSSIPEYHPRIINLRDTEFKIIGKVIGDFKTWK